MRRVRNPVRGVLHGLAAGLGLAGTIWLTSKAVSPEGMLGFTVFGMALTGLFVTSALYHSAPWNPAALARMQRLDHSMIFILIAATFTPFGVLTLSGWSRLGALTTAWGLAIAGVGTVMAKRKTGDRPRVVAMIALGWLSLAVAGPLAQQVGFIALGLLVVGGLLYSIGGVLFALEWPRLWPRVFSYHEAFHTLVVGGAALHFAAVTFSLLPLDAMRG